MAVIETRNMESKRVNWRRGVAPSTDRDGRTYLGSRPHPASRWLRGLGIGCGWAGLLMLWAGCSSPSATTQERLLPVTGQVWLDEVPVAQAHVLFIPLVTDINDERHYPISWGQTDETGKFTLQASGKELGAIPGKHFVLISQRQSLDKKRSEEPGLPSLPAAEEQEFPSGAPLGNQFGGLFAQDPFRSAYIEKIPERYNFLSELRAQVAEQPTSHFEFRLQSKPAGLPRP